MATPTSSTNLDLDVLRVMTEAALLKEQTPNVPAETSTSFRDGVRDTDKLLEETRETAMALATKLADLVGQEGIAPSSAEVQAHEERKRELLVRVGVLRVLGTVCTRLFEGMRREGV